MPRLDAAAFCFSERCFLLRVAAQTKCHDRECAGDVHARFAACHRDSDFHGCFGHDFRGDAEFFVAENDKAFFWPCYVVYAWNVFACFKSDDFVAVFFVPFDAVEWALPTFDGYPFLAAARSAFYSHVVWVAAVAAEVHAFEPEAVCTADDGAHVECATQVVDEHRKLNGLFVSHFAVAWFLFQINVSFKT